MSGAEPRYLSYLLRLWQVRTEGQLVWRASLESPHTGERTGFLSLEALFAFLERLTLVVECSQEPGGETSRGGRRTRSRDERCRPPLGPSSLGAAADTPGRQRSAVSLLP